MTKLTQREQWGLPLSHRQNNAWSSCSVFGFSEYICTVFGTILCKLEVFVMLGESQKITSSLWMNQTSCTNNQQPCSPCSLQSPFFLILMLALNFSELSSPRLHAPDALRCYHVIGGLLVSASNGTFYRIKRPVSACGTCIKAEKRELRECQKGR